MGEDLGHVVYRGPEGETTVWDDVQRRFGNKPPLPEKFVPRAYAPEEDRGLRAAVERDGRAGGVAHVDAAGGTDALEAMAAGCSVIASEVGGLAEVVDHRRTGLTVRANDTQSIAWAVDQLFTDPVQAQAMRARALQEVTRSYNWVAIAVSTLNMYRAVVSQRQGVNW